jgi:hypothetical protein
MKHMDARELQLRNQALDFAIHELDRRGAHMTPVDRDRALALKKERLVTKDRLHALAHR